MKRVLDNVAIGILGVIVLLMLGAICYIVYTAPLTFSVIGIMLAGFWAFERVSNI